MVNFTSIPDQSKRNPWILIRSIPTAITPDSRWGLVQICLSLFFFFFGLAIAIVQFYETSLWGGALMWLAIAFGVVGIGMLVLTICLGWHYWAVRKNDDYPVLILTKGGELKIDVSVITLKTDDLLKVVSGRYDMEIRSREEGGTDEKPK